MRRLLAILAALALLAAIPAARQRRKRRTESTTTSSRINCDGIAPTSGTGFLFLGVSISDDFGPGCGFVEMWNAFITGRPAGHHP